jgi:membrane protease YdiL (CAAX protease family)
MAKPLLNEETFFISACYFEGSLIIIAIILGYVTQINPFAFLSLSETAFALGIIGTIPLCFLFMSLQHVNIQAIQQIRKLLLETLCPYLIKRHWSELLLLALIAGVSEEILFRGFLQPWLESFFSITTSLILSNIVFALLHAITPTYAILAMLMGLYLGLSLDISGERYLLIPIVIHSLYDFFAFVLLLHSYRKMQELNK